MEDAAKKAGASDAASTALASIQEVASVALASVQKAAETYDAGYRYRYAIWGYSDTPFF